MRLPRASPSQRLRRIAAQRQPRFFAALRMTMGGGKGVRLPRRHSAEGLLAMTRGKGLPTTRTSMPDIVKLRAEYSRFYLDIGRSRW